ncbi:MAG: pitrilysin family protein, partial [bacterium]|nr:pitrilysin family protein [bacterium]
MGSHTERPGQEGISHFVEHMIFKGSRNLEVGGLAGLAEMAGGDINAYTMSDATCYVLTCLPETMETCLDAMADALWRPNFDPLEVEREQSVILEEIYRADDEPEQKLQKKLFRLAYGKSHPYGQPILGSAASVRGISARDLRRYHRERYAPPKACVVLVGPIDKREGRRRAGRILADLRPGGRLVLSRPAGRMRIPRPSPSSRGPRFFTMPGRTGVAHFELAFEVPPVTHPDAPAIEALAMILGAGESSRLYRTLCAEAGILDDVSTDPFLSAGPGLLFLGGGGDAGKIAPAAAEMIRQALALGGALPPEEEEVARVLRWFEADLEFRRESAGGRARIAGYAEIVAGNPRFALQYFDRILKLTPEK